MISLPLRAPATVGRAREIAFLRDLLAGVRDARSPAVVLIEGPAGIGKTRLVDELLAYHDGDAVAVTATHTEILRRPLLGLHLGFDRAACACEDGVRPELEELAMLLGSDRTLDKARRFAEIAKALTRLAGPRSITLVVEDVGWADATTIELVRFLAAQVRGVPLFTVLTAREQGESWIERFPTAAHVRLAPLTSAETLLLLRKTALEHGAALADGLREIGVLSAGNPFYALELLRYRLEGERAMPATIALPIQRRCARLGAATRRVLEAAALAETFVAEDLIALCGLSAGSIDAALAEAAAAGIVCAHAGGPAFAHAITRAAIVDAIPVERSVPLHRRFAERLEARCADDASRLAHHWRLAGERERAARFSAAAADQAYAMSAFSDAIPHFTHALALRAHDDPVRGPLLERLGFAYLLTGRFAEARPVLDEAYACFTASGVGDGATRVELHRARMLHQLADPAGARAALDAALARIADRPPSELSMKVWAGCVQIVAYNAEREAVRAVLHATRPSLPFADATQLGAYHCVFAKLSAADGDVEGYRRHATAAVDAAERAEQVEPLVAILANVGSYAPFLGLAADAHSALVRGLDLAHEFELPFHALGIATQLARFALLEGRQDDASAWLAEILASPVRATPMGRLWTVGCGIPVALSTGNEAMLVRCAAAATMDDALATGNAELIAMPAVAWVRHAVYQGERERAAVLLSRALAAVKDATMPPFLGAWIALAGSSETQQAALSHRDWPQHRAGRAERALLDAVAAREAKNRRAAAAFAEQSAALYEALGWPAYRAYALDLAGRRGEAQRLLASAGEPALPLGRDAGAVDAFAPLTPRERDVAERAAAGKTNRAIADELGLSARTVENYLQSAFERLGVRSRAQLGDYVKARDATA